MASLRFHKVSSLPASCALGDVYYVVGQGIYVCTTAASSGATESANYTRFSYANNADTTAKGVVSLTDIKGVKVNSAAAADSATTATNYASTGTIASKFSTVDDSISDINTKIGKINAVVDGKTLKITKPDGNTVTFTDTDTHNQHKVTFTNGDPTNSTGNSVAVVTTANSSATASSGDIVASTTRVNVPTLAVTSGLANRISSLESTATTGMQYKGTTAAVPTSGKVGDVWKCSGVISSLGAEAGDFIVCSKTGSGTSATWDVWQANVNKDAYWDTNTPVSGNFVAADGTTGKIKDSGYNFGSFDTKGAAAGVLGTSGDAAGTATVYGALASAAAAQTAANSAKDIANGKWTAADASTSVKGIMKVGTGLEASSGTVSVKYGSDAGTACQGNDSRLNDARTPLAHNQASNTINLMTGYAKASSATAIATSDSLNTAIGKLEKGVEDAKSAAGGKWAKAYAQALAAGDGSKAGVATFDSSNFTVSSVGHVGLVWATWPES